MAKRKAVDLRLEVAESNAAVDVKLLRDGKAVLDFTNDEPPPVRVQGFNNPTTVERLLEFAERESVLSSEGAGGMLRLYIRHREKEVYGYARELRRLMRKMVIAAEARTTAQSALAILQEQRAGSGELPE